MSYYYVNAEKLGKIHQWGSPPKLVLKLYLKDEWETAQSSGTSQKFM